MVPGGAHTEKRPLPARAASTRSLRQLRRRAVPARPPVRPVPLLPRRAAGRRAARGCRGSFPRGEPAFDLFEQTHPEAPSCNHLQDFSRHGLRLPPPLDYSAALRQSREGTRSLFFPSTRSSTPGGTSSTARAASASSSRPPTTPCLACETPPPTPPRTPSTSSTPDDGVGVAGAFPGLSALTFLQNADRPPSASAPCSTFLRCPWPAGASKRPRGATRAASRARGGAARAGRALWAFV